MLGFTLRLRLSLVGVLALLAVTPACSSNTDEPPEETPDAGVPDSGTPETPVVPERAACSGLTLGPGDHEFTLTHQGRARVFRVHIPPAYDATKPTPVVLNFHGYGLNEQLQELLSQLSTVADEEGFIAVHPRGLSLPEITGTTPAPDAGPDDSRGWNAGGCCGPSQVLGVDDVGFVDAMLAALASDVCVDARRIYATGLSNGAFFTYRLACERAQLIAAIAPVAGMEALTPCTPSRPVPVLHFHGTADMSISYDGGTVPFGGSYPSAPESVARWAERNGCKGPLVETYQQGDSTCVTHSGCSPENATATLCTVEGGGHTWPGGLVPEDAGYGHTTQDLDASREAWRFFQARPRP